MLSEGQILHDRYELQQILGKKPGRRTYRAIDQRTQSPVVVKVLLFSTDLDWDHVKLFQREGQILQTLTIKAIPKYLDAFDLDLPGVRGFALVQTYIDAPSIETQLKSGRTFSEAELRQIAQQVLEILIQLQNRNPAIVHRDIKPSNLLMSQTRSAHSVGEIYLVDFGSVQNIAATQDGTFTITGTYGYMAPEQFGGRAVPASDVYGLGATLVYLLSGVHPADLMRDDGRIRFEAQISPDFARWMRRAIEPHVSQRFDSAQAALDALDAPPTLQTQRDSWQVQKPIHSQLEIQATTDFFKVRLPSGIPTGIIILVELLASVLGIAICAIVLVGITFSGIGLFLLLPLIWLGLYFYWLRGELPLSKSHFDKGLLICPHQVRFGSRVYAISNLDAVRVCITARPRLLEKRLWLRLPNEEHLFLHEELSASEIEWLAYKLSQWLEQPIEYHELSPDLDRWIGAKGRVTDTCDRIRCGQAEFQTEQPGFSLKMPIVNHNAGILDENDRVCVISAEYRNGLAVLKVRRIGNP